MPPEGETPDATALQDEIARLKAELDGAKRMATETAQLANSLDNQNSQASARLFNAQISQLATQEAAADAALSATEQEIRGLKEKIAALQGEGKFAEVADAMEQLGDASARRRQAMQAKDYYAGQKAQASNAPSDPVDQFIAANRGAFTENDVAWIKQNRRYAQDENFRRRVIDAHEEAVRKLNIAPGTPEYYRHLEERGYMQSPSQPKIQPKPETRAEPQRELRPEDGAAPTGYSGEEDDVPQIIIKDPMTENGTAADTPPDNPQPRAAGPGSLRAAVAAAPSRRPIGAASGRRIVMELTKEQRDTAMALAPYMAGDDVLKGGEPAILQWYWNDLKESPAALRIKEGWSA